MAAGLQGHSAFTGAIDEAEKYLHNMGATWSLKGTQIAELFLFEFTRLIYYRGACPTGIGITYQ